jgi:sugar lactone lactonase YvrE
VIDGIAFDAYGNLWATMILSERLVAITPEGDLLELFDNGDTAAVQRFEECFATGETVPFDVSLACRGTVTNWMASVTFGGSDLSTVYLGSLRDNTLPSFRSPVAGLPMVHW